MSISKVVEIANMSLSLLLPFNTHLLDVLPKHVHAKTMSAPARRFPKYHHTRDMSLLERRCLLSKMDTHPPVVSKYPIQVPHEHVESGYKSLTSLPLLLSFNLHILLGVLPKQRAECAMSVPASLSQNRQ